jgi:hypothetical protein
LTSNINGGYNDENKERLWKETGFEKKNHYGPGKQRIA